LTWKWKFGFGKLDFLQFPNFWRFLQKPINIKAGDYKFLKMFDSKSNGREKSKLIFVFQKRKNRKIKLFSILTSKIGCSITIYKFITGIEKIIRMAIIGSWPVELVFWRVPHLDIRTLKPKIKFEVKIFPKNQFWIIKWQTRVIFYW